MDPQQIVDVWEIQQLKARYFRTMDLKLWDEFRDVFTDDLKFYFDTSKTPQTQTPTVESADALVEYLSSLDPDRRTIHQGHMPEIKFSDADHATGIWAMFDWVDDLAGGWAIKGYGHYHEKYVRCPDGKWRICESRLTRLRTNYVDHLDSEPLRGFTREAVDRVLADRQPPGSAPGPGQ